MQKKILAWIPQLNFQVWSLAAGRLLSQIGSGFTLFYAPIFFVNQVGLSATAVGMGLGLGSVAGVLGRFFGGSLTDSKLWGRRRTLLLSAVISAVSSFILALTYDFPSLVIGNLCMGFAVGLYWPATEAAVADLTTIEQRNEAFAITRLADVLGLGIGVVLGGWLIANTGGYRLLFVIDGISFIVFFVVIFWSITETYSFHEQVTTLHKGWFVALRDRPFIIYLLVNILFTTYISQVQSTMPLYFSIFVSSKSPGNTFSADTISAIFSWYIIFSSLCQLPIARLLNYFSRTQALMLSLLLWGVGFILVWMTGIVPHHAIIWAIFTLSILAIATVTYTPVSSALVVELAPESLRGVYLSLNSQCWAIGYFIGPLLGGFALDSAQVIAHSFWLAAAVSISIGILILQYLNHLLNRDGEANSY